MLIGGDGNDIVIGGRGNDVALARRRQRHLHLEPGRRQRHVEGQAGTDTLVFNGANVDENIDISANGSGRGCPATSATSPWTSTASSTSSSTPLGGADTVTVNDLTGTDVTQVAIDLAATPGSGRATAQPDTVIVNGTRRRRHDQRRRAAARRLPSTGWRRR